MPLTGALRLMLGSISTSGKEERLALIKGTFYAQVPDCINEIYKNHARTVMKAYQRGDRGKGREMPLETMRIIARVAQAGLLSGKQLWIDKESKKITEIPREVFSQAYHSVFQ